MVAWVVLNHTFKHAWQDISLANWFKYPSPSRPDVLNIELVNRDFDPHSGVLTTTRLVTMKNVLPTWVQKITGCTAPCYFVEQATIDSKNNKMELTATNVSFRQVIEMQEKCEYTVHKENKDWTNFIQEAKVTVFTYGISRKVEEMCAQMFRQNASKGRDLMEQTIARIKQETEEKLLAVEEFSNRMKKETEEKLQAVEEFGNRIKQETEELMRKEKERRVGLLALISE